MSEINTPRLMAAAKEFNIGTNTLIDFLVSKSFSSDELKPTTKLSEQMYRVLQSEFQQDKAAKQKAEAIDLPKGAGANEPKRKRDEEDLSIKKKEDKPKPIVKEEVKIEEKPVELPPPVEEPTPPPEPVVSEEPATAAPPISNIEAPELEAPKVIDKIDLEAIDQSTRPKKSSKKAAAAKTEIPAVEITAPAGDEVPEDRKKVKEEATAIAPIPVVAIEEQKDEAPVITNIQAEKLTGPKILGKITLPVDSDTRPKKDDEKHKRKRIPMQKKPGAPPQGSNIAGGRPIIGQRQIVDNRPGANRGTGASNRFARPAQTNGTPARREDKVIDAK
ncbi:MAG: translation initiation factor IF-2, partial [Ferruginibacter sp.]